MRRPLLFLFSAIVCLFSLQGCGIIDYFYLPPPEDTAQELFEAGNDAMREKRYATAAEYYQKLKDLYPFSPYGVEAELSLGDAYFLDEDYVMAGEVYKEFEMLHPRHDAVPYVLYQTGRSLQKSFISIDRPTSGIAEAMEFYQRLIDEYPGTEYADMSLVHIQECRRTLAEREIFIGDFYQRTERYGAAWLRYKYVLDNFGDIEDLSAAARKRGQLAYLKYTQQKGRQEMEEREGTWKNLFRWL